MTTEPPACPQCALPAEGFEPGALVVVLPHPARGPYAKPRLTDTLAAVTSSIDYRHHPDLPDDLRIVLIDTTAGGPYSPQECRPATRDDLTRVHLSQVEHLIRFHGAGPAVLTLLEPTGPTVRIDIDIAAAEAMLAALRAQLAAGGQG